MAAATRGNRISENEVKIEAARQLANADSARRTLTRYYQNEPKRTVKLAPMYQPYVGRVMTVTLNGVSIYFRVDGSPQSVPASFADEIESREAMINAMLNKKSRMADIAQNLESSPGELRLF